MTSKKLTKMLCKQSHQLWRVKKSAMQSIFKTDKMRGKYFFPFYCNSNIRSPGIQNIHTTVIHLHHFEEKQNEKKKKNKCRVATKYSAAQM